ncbi:MAG: hypothetical protein KatS3mg092_0246 [Patescibacteria group bacterium]|nr:MAG: hypothetical protein KatS3mg092_0246 [Patescibacteria group bacterium]
MKTYHFNITAENKPGVLYRITNLLLKRKINIETINAYPTKNKTISKIFFSINIDENKVKNIAQQINKIIEVIDVNYHL